MGVLASTLWLATFLIALATPPEVVHQRQQEFHAARARLEALGTSSSSNSLAAIHEFCRTAYELASVQSQDSDRARITQVAIATAQASLSNSPASAPTHYYLALNLGELARTKSLGALKIVPRIRDSLEAARALDESIDHAGPDRTLGRLYLEAPGWPTSLGSRSKARAHFLRAVQLAPEYPGNHLALAEALLQWREFSAARSQLRAADSIWTQARSQLSGPRWEPDWAEWTQRRQSLVEKLGRSSN